jgi:hypothetical protein
MSELRKRFERAAEQFRPTGDWLEGAMQRARRRQRLRRMLSAAFALVLFAGAFALLWALRPASDEVPAGPPACPRSWVKTSPEVAAGGFAAVSATAADDVWAVGAGGQQLLPGSLTIIEHWNGKRWQRIASPNGATGAAASNELHGVVAISPNDAWAVGQYSESVGGPLRILAVHWDGKSWSIVPAPDPSEAENGLEDVAASGPNDVWAVGYSVVGNHATTLVEHWDGKQWSVVSTSDLSSGGSGAVLKALSIVSANDIWAVGSQPSGVLFEHWDGSAWSVIDAPAPEDQAFLTDLDASGPNDVWAAGWTSGSGSANRATPPVVEHYDGTHWDIVEVPDTPEQFATPLAVTAVSPQDVWITGWTGPSNEADRYAEQRAFVAHWDGNAWTFPDIGLGQPPQILWAATETDGTVTLAGSEGGSFTGTTAGGSIQGDHPLASFGECADRTD